MEIIEDAEELQKLWKNKAAEQIAPNMEKAQERLLNAGLAKEQVAMKVVHASQSAADEILKEIPVIVVTAKDKPIDQVLGIHVAKVDAYLVKADFGPKELLDSVRQVLGEI